MLYQLLQKQCRKILHRAVSEIYQRQLFHILAEIPNLISTTIFPKCLQSSKCRCLWAMRTEIAEGGVQNKKIKYQVLGQNCSLKFNRCSLKPLTLKFNGLNQTSRVSDATLLSPHTKASEAI